MSKIKTLSGIVVDVSERDMQWIKWAAMHGLCDESISKFLELNPPSSPTAEAPDLKSDQCEFKSHGGENLNPV